MDNLKTNNKSINYGSAVCTEHNNMNIKYYLADKDEIAVLPNYEHNTQIVGYNTPLANALINATEEQLNGELVTYDVCGNKNELFIKKVRPNYIEYLKSQINYGSVVEVKHNNIDVTYYLAKYDDNIVLPVDKSLHFVYEGSPLAYVLMHATEEQKNGKPIICSIYDKNHEIVIKKIYPGYGDYFKSKMIEEEKDKVL